MTPVTNEQWLRATFDEIAGTALVDEALGRGAAREALARRTRDRTRRRSVAAVVALCAVVGVGIGIAARNPDRGVHTVNTGPTPTTPRPAPSLTVVKAIAGSWAPDPIAFDGHDVWLARRVTYNSGQGTGERVQVERRDAASGRLLRSIVVHQETVFAIAADGAGSVWVAGGGDGAVPHTTVSRIDTTTNHIVFTHTLVNQSCSCRIAAGPGAAWLGANGEKRVLRLDPRTGEVTAVTPLPTLAFSLAVVGDRLQVGLNDSRVAVVDPATNRVERIVGVHAPGLSQAGVIVDIDPVPVSPGHWDSWVTRTDGYAFSIVGNDHVTGAPLDFLRPVGIASAAVIGNAVWAVGFDQLIFDPVAPGAAGGFANYDQAHASFGRTTLRRDRFVPVIDSTSSPGLDVVVAAGDTLWLADFEAKILVVRVDGKLPG